MYESAGHIDHLFKAVLRYAYNWWSIHEVWAGGEQQG
jgi:hypothetical protein